MTDVEEQEQALSATPAATTSESSGAATDKKSDNGTDAGSVKMSMVSKAYDRGNKGYLDSTEMKIRALDKNNDGVLDINEVYQLMQGFEKEQKKAVTLKYVVISLSVFALLLCVANIGTGFAAATLAKDVTTAPEGYLVDKHTGQGLASLEVETVIQMDPGPDFNETDDVNGTLTDDVDGPLTEDVVNSTDVNGTRFLNRYNNNNYYYNNNVRRNNNACGNQGPGGNAARNQAACRHQIENNGRYNGNGNGYWNYNNPRLATVKVDRIMTAFCPRDWNTVYGYGGNRCPSLLNCGVASAGHVVIEACNSNRRVRLYPSRNGLRPVCDDWINGRPRRMVFFFDTDEYGEVTFVCDGNRFNSDCDVVGIRCNNYY